MDIYKQIEKDKLLSNSFDAAGVLALFLFISIRNNVTTAVVILYFILYVLKDARRTIVVDVCGDHMNKHERATVMSIESQLTSLFTIVLAPLFGLIGDKLSIAVLFLIIGLFSLIVNRFLKVSNAVN